MSILMPMTLSIRKALALRNFEAHRRLVVAQEEQVRHYLGYVHRGEPMRSKRLAPRV